MPSVMPAAQGAWWDTGSTVAPCTCAVLLSPVRGVAGGDTAGCGNNVASCTVGNGLGRQGLGSGWAGAMLCKNHCVPWGQDMWLCRAAWAGDGVLCKCMSPAVANIHLRQCVCTCCLLQGCRHECATAANGQAGAQALVAPHGAPLHAGVRARPCETCLCMASLHAVHPQALGSACVHPPQHIGTGEGQLMCVGCVPSATCMCTWCCAMLVPPGVCAWKCARCGHPRVHVHIVVICAWCQSARCPTAWIAAPVLPPTWGACGLTPGNAPSRPH